MEAQYSGDRATVHAGCLHADMHLLLTGLLEYPAPQSPDLSHTRPKHPRSTLLDGHHQFILAHIDPDTEMTLVHCRTPPYIIVEDASAYLVHAGSSRKRRPQILFGVVRSCDRPGELIYESGSKGLGRAKASSRPVSFVQNKIQSGR